MATPPSNTPQSDTQEELEKKLADIGEKEEARTAKSIADELGLPFADLKGLPIDPEALRTIPEEVARSSGVALVQKQARKAVAATTDPRTPAAKKQLEALKKLYADLNIIVVAPSTMRTIFSRYETIKTAETFEVGSIDIDDAALQRSKEEIHNVDDLKQRIADANITQLFEILIAGALAVGASDIHLEPESDGTRVRYRLDGLLSDVVSIDTARTKRVLNRIKVLTKMKLNVTKAPQDGRFTIRESDTDIEVRVSLLPSEYGESVVMRLLDPRNLKTKLEELGMREDILARVRNLLEKPQGTFLTTGPTGSGKTTTLYAFVNELNAADTKIITVEDPIEYHISGINQTQVEPDKGYTFASGLRAIVRQDPDIILIGEIRDLETAEISLNAALTGHLVLSTIHTNDAAGTIPRLVDLGVKSETVAPALTMAMGQRLLRRLCPSCKKETTLPKEELARVVESLKPIQDRFELPNLDASLKVFEAVGCSECNGLGYRGRIGVYEVLEVTRDMERLILSTPAVSDIRDLAIKEGMVTMLQDGYLKLVEGITSIEEVRRVLG